MSARAHAVLDLDCGRDLRREAVRAASRNGLDYLEVSDDQRTLTIYFLGKAPEEIAPAQVRIEGGRRVRDLRVVDVTIRRDPRDDRDDAMDVRVDRAGDFSVYTLRLVETDAAGEPAGPMRGFDPRYAALEFSFKAGCPSELDCAAPGDCPPPLRPAPDIDYLARDYAGLRRLLLDRMALLLPGWTERHVPDIGIALVELLAYTGDQLAAFQDAVATEAYLGTARQRISVRRHARLVDYRMHEGCNARAWISIESDADFTLPLAGTAFLTRFDGAPEAARILARDELARVPAGAYEQFEPLPLAVGAAAPAPEELLVRAAWSEIHFYTWGGAECCLPRGATEATLVDGWGQGDARLLDGLAPGQVLLFEEVRGPRTGVPGDADPSHRHAVRLEDVRRSTDPLYPGAAARPAPVVEIRWRAEDALPFPLCLSATLPAPDCGPLPDVSVARGNVVLVDHGRGTGEDLDPPATDPPRPTCDPCEDAAPPPPPRRYEPTLDGVPLTWAEPLDTGASAVRLLSQDRRRALPAVELAAADGTWSPREDLLAGRPGERGFVVEIDNDGVAHLRFGPAAAARPAPGAAPRVRYRVGNGTGGNVGAEAIALLVTRDRLDTGAAVVVRNPLPAAGGTAPEPIADVKLLAPGAYRTERRRAIVARDYAELAARDFTTELQGAAAALRWNGSWYEAQVGVDPRGAAEAPAPLLRRVTRRLFRYRRIGHDLRVRSARQVPLAVELHVCLEPDARRGDVRAALLARLGTGVLADGALGLFHPDSLEYGADVALSRLVLAAQGVPGVTSVAVTKLERLGEGPAGELESGVLPLGPLEIARLDNDPGQPEHGTLTLTLEGGR